MGSMETPPLLCRPALPESSCDYLLQELKLIWDEVGSSEEEREKVLLELEQECIEVYRRKVDIANISRARLHQKLAETEVEFTRLLLSLGERSFAGRPEKMTGTLKEQLELITPALQEMRQRKEERMKQFREIQNQIQKISAEISGNSDGKISLLAIQVNENDLSSKKLEDYQAELQRLRNDKKYRLRKVEEYRHALHELAETLGMDSSEIIANIHPGLVESFEIQLKNISDLILDRLSSTIDTLKNEKQRRVDKLSRLGKSLMKLWNLMDTPVEEQRLFAHITAFVSAKVTDILSPRSLAIDTIQQAELEVKRLDQLKASKMKDLFLKKHKELEMTCKRSHMEIPSQSQINHIIDLINSGEMDHADLLTSMDEQIFKAKDEAASRKNIMEKVEKWMAACAEERWLDEYNMDHNRYSVSRDAHKNLQRAGRARITVNKIPALVGHLIIKTRSWEEERKKVFLYDEVPLLEMLEEYNLLKQEKEEEKQRQREKKRLQNQPVAGKFHGSRPTTSNSHITERNLNDSFGSISSFRKRVSLAEKRGTTGIPTSHRLKTANKEKKEEIMYSGTPKAGSTS